jgi:fatty-acyl-CoA synthase
MDTTENYTVRLLERLKATGSREAVVAGDRRISGTEALGAVLRHAAVLRDMGLREGDGVALFARNSPEAVLVSLAVHFAGLRLVFVPAEPGPGELEAYVRRAEASAFLYDPVLEDRARVTARWAGVPHVLSLGPPDSAVPGPDEAADPAHLATLLYTGGTTGSPKLVLHRSGYYEALTEQWGAYSTGEPGREGLLVCSPVTHVSGHIFSLAGLATGHTVVLLRSFDAGTALSVMRREPVTRVGLVTPMLYELLDHPAWPAEGFPGLDRVFCTGAAAAPVRLLQAFERLGPVLQQSYGASETGPITDFMPGDHDPARPETLTSCGRPSAGTEVDLRDDRGESVTDGCVGEVCVRSRTVMTGYWKDPEATARVLDADGWFHTGDLARRDADGLLHLVDRVRDVIVTGRTADNVYSRLLDDFLLTLPEVRDAAAVGRRDADGAEKVHVVLVPQDPAAPPDTEELTRRVVKALGELYAPASYSFAASLPRTGVGKTDKRALRDALRT